VDFIFPLYSVHKPEIEEDLSLTYTQGKENDVLAYLLLKTTNPQRNHAMNLLLKTTIPQAQSRNVSAFKNHNPTRATTQ